MQDACLSPKQVYPLRPAVVALEQPTSRQGATSPAYQVRRAAASVADCSAAAAFLYLHHFDPAAAEVVGDAVGC